MWEKVLVYHEVANCEEMKKVVSVPGENALPFLTAKPLSCPLPSVVCVLGILLVSWGTKLGMLQLPCGTVFLGAESRGLGGLGVPGENKT